MNALRNLPLLRVYVASLEYPCTTGHYPPPYEWSAKSTLLLFNTKWKGLFQRPLIFRWCNVIEHSTSDDGRVEEERSSYSKLANSVIEADR